MKRRKAVLIIIPILIGAGALAVLNRPRAPLVRIGSHEVAMRFVPFSEANPKPWIDLKLPVVGRIVYPRREPLTGVNPADDGRFIAGYIIVERPLAAWMRTERMDGVDADFALIGEPLGYWVGEVDRNRSILPVLYPRSAVEASQPSIIIAGRERVKVWRSFDASKLPARYPDTVVNLGKVKITARFDSFVDGAPLIDLEIAAPADYGTVGLQTKDGSISSSSRMSGPLPTTLDVHGKVDQDGTITVKGEFSIGLGDAPTGAPMPVEIKIRPKAPGAIKAA